jgi:hypothetical protein
MKLKVKYLNVDAENKYKKLFELFKILYDLDLNNTDILVANKLYNESKILNKTIIDFDNKMTTLFSSKHKDNMMKELGLSYNNFNNSLTKLRKCKLVVNNALYKYFDDLDFTKELDINITL